MKKKNGINVYVVNISWSLAYGSLITVGFRQALGGSNLLDCLQPLSRDSIRAFFNDRIKIRENRGQ